jgi:hypothetical protein
MADKIVVIRKPKGQKGVEISWPLHVYREGGKKVYTGKDADDQLKKEKEEKKK